MLPKIIKNIITASIFIGVAGSAAYFFIDNKVATFDEARPSILAKNAEQADLESGVKRVDIDKVEVPKLEPEVNLDVNLDEPEETSNNLEFAGTKELLDLCSDVYSGRELACIEALTKPNAEVLAATNYNQAFKAVNNYLTSFTPLSEDSGEKLVNIYKQLNKLKQGYSFTAYQFVTDLTRAIELLKNQYAEYSADGFKDLSAKIPEGLTIGEAVINQIKPVFQFDTTDITRKLITFNQVNNPSEESIAIITNNLNSLANNLFEVLNIVLGEDQVATYLKSEEEIYQYFYLKATLQLEGILAMSYGLIESANFAPSNIKFILSSQLKYYRKQVNPTNPLLNEIYKEQQALNANFAQYKLATTLDVTEESQSSGEEK